MLDDKTLILNGIYVAVNSSLNNWPLFYKLILRAYLIGADFAKGRTFFLDIYQLCMKTKNLIINSGLRI